MTFLMGALITQVAYNAAALKDPSADSEFRGALATISPWDGASARMRADIAALKRIPYTSKGGTWEDINAAATAAVLDIVNEK